MKKKSKVIAALVMLIFLMSSCVYSLFPIYTAENQIFIPEIVGKWQSVNDGANYALIESYAYESAYYDSINQQRPTYTITYADGYAVENGDTIRDEALIERLKANQPDALGAVQGVMKGLKKVANDLTFRGRPISDKSYRMTMYNDGKAVVYQMNLAKIGEDIFMDLYFNERDSSEDNFNMVLFPVHTFLKIELRNNQLDLIQFDLDKLNKLFKSNLIRLRNENVDGTILITAQPKELQKFLDKYSDDESVFEESESYTRILQ